MLVHETAYQRSPHKGHCTLLEECLSLTSIQKKSSRSHPQHSHGIQSEGDDTRRNFSEQCLLCSIFRLNTERMAHRGRHCHLFLLLMRQKAI